MFYLCYSHCAIELTTDEIVGQGFLFFLAGYDTTASLLRFAAYNLAVHQDAQDKLVEEIQNAIGNVSARFKVLYF
jgi:cytochrome P450